MTDLEERLLAMLERERELNILLTQALLPQQTVTISGAPKSIGRVPWPILKAKLESRNRKPNGEESISNTDEQHDAGGDNRELFVSHEEPGEQDHAPKEET